MAKRIWLFAYEMTMICDLVTLGRIGGWYLVFAHVHMHRIFEALEAGGSDSTHDSLASCLEQRGTIENSFN